jgi:FG-GAP-like repeat
MATGTVFPINLATLTIVDNVTVSESIDLNPFGIWGRITDLRVFIQDVSHTFPDDLDFLLLGPGGANLEFWSDAGGSTDITNFDFAFADSFSPLFLPDSTQISPSTITYAATDYGSPTEDSSNWGLSSSIIINHPTPTGTATFASAFGGLFTGGTWSLYVRDDVAGDVGSLHEWSMQITYNVIVKPEDFSGPIGANNNFYTSDILWQNDSGQAAIWLMNGTSLTGSGLVGPNPGPSWHVIDSGDFDSDGRSDILWQDDSGQAAIWLMNGTSLTGGALVGPNPGPSWHVKASGDFNFDSKADILWQNDSGQAAIWLMDGTSLTSGALVGPNPGPSWQVQGTGDYNGDGRSDILWQSNDGTPAMWFMDGTNFISGGLAGSNPGHDWDVIA